MRSLLLLLLIGWTASAAERKNVIVLVADDLGMQVGCYGDTQAKTPYLDALAKQGTRFTKAFASVASCSPSRATMLTGLPTHQNGQYGLAHATHNQHSFASVKSLPGLLSAAGYRTGVIGKLHVLPKDVFAFDEIIGDPGRNPVSMAEKTDAFMTKAGDQPFFLWLGYTDPHRAAKGFANDNKYPASVPKAVFDPKTLKLPYHLPDNEATRAEWAEYYQSVSRLDYGVGLILKLLEDKKLADNTLVVFLSDNGIPFPGAKTTLYDSGVHLPLIVRKPGQKPGITNEAMASWTDLAPTVLDWCGVKPDAAMKGRSILPILEEPTPKGWDTVYGSHQFHEVTMYYPMRMVRTRIHKLLVNLAHPLEYPFASDLWDSDMYQSVLKQKLTTLGEREFKTFLHRPKFELYDLVNDPKELRNLANDPKHAETVKTMEADLLKWQQATKDPWLMKSKHE